MAGATRPLMQVLALTMEDDVACMELHPAPYQRSTGICCKRDKDQV